MLRHRLAGHILLATLAILPAEVCSSLHVSRQVSVTFWFTAEYADSICLVVFSLLAETPHELHYYWKYVLANCLRKGSALTRCTE
jgi:hypothetical protein